MRGLRKYLTPFAPDQSGAVSVLYEFGGIIVICDAGGCTGNICGFDEPRWFESKSALFIHSISSGEILLDGEVLCSADKQAQPGSDRIVVFQNGALFPWFTVLENVTFGPIVQKAMRKEEAEDKAMEMLGQMGLMGIENNYPSEISSGMRRRVEIARAMMNNPRVLLLDEPFRAMDALTKTVVHQFLLQVYDRSKTTVFFITHDLEEAIFLGSKVYIMTTRPATIKKILDVDIPRPRDFRVLSSPTYTRLKEECISAVHEEALKAFKAGEREM